ncbi:MAG TPA: DUF4956 domain-containing protein [Oligoflexus sp.]|uniref:DUF4956 domain-containing protein n=1 Tax=Oligoflexus sp. TaxID=1971216 RepID=UPI002D2C47C6|nr:DUF4956 domain-containing protein [Oligoflexus sp.]HYX34253.1 DUF4956 domain-containing protein [Oligoflexus sp.]
MLQNFLDNLGEAAEAGSMGDVQNFILCMAISMAFGVLTMQLYKFYFRDNEPQDGSLARSLVLLIPALTATFWIIQSSVILSLGLLGSLSFVRFRTPVKRPEDITFIVIALSVAISCATMNFIIGATLMLLLFGFTLVRNMWGTSGRGKYRLAVITFNTKNSNSINDLWQTFNNLNVQADFISSRTYDGITSYVFNTPKITQENHSRVAEALALLDQGASFHIFYPNERLGV